MTNFSTRKNFVGIGRRWKLFGQRRRHPRGHSAGAGVTTEISPSQTEGAATKATSGLVLVIQNGGLDLTELRLEDILNGLRLNAMPAHFELRVDSAGGAHHIGSPFANVTYHPRGEPTPSHCLTGRLESSVSWGDVHAGTQLAGANRPEVHHAPQFGRLYRPGTNENRRPNAARALLAESTRSSKCAGHRVEAQAFEDVLQSQFGEIEARRFGLPERDAWSPLLPRLQSAKRDLRWSTPAPAEVARGGRRRCKQTSKRVDPDEVFLVEKFVMMPVIGE